MVIMRRVTLLAGKLALMWLGLAAAPSRADSIYVALNLVTDNQQLVRAPFTDPNLVNPWGISYSPKGPFWIADNNSGVSTLYQGDGTPIPFVVSIPGPGGTAGAPTGNVFNPGAKAGDFHGDAFIFSAEDGTISGWHGGPSAVAEVPGVNANVYKGLAIGKSGGTPFIYATNFRQGQVDVYDTNFNFVKSFTDPSLPAGYAPFGIQNIGGKLYVTFALQNAAKHDDVSGPGHGFVDVFDTNGNLLQQFTGGGPLNSPWGLALAPAKFGQFSNDLLVGNFGNSIVNAFDPNTGAFLGTLSDANHNPLVLTNPGGEKGLWGLIFGNGAGAGDPNTLFFTSGINDESDGLFGQIDVVPEPDAALLAVLGGLGVYGFRAWRSRRGSKARC
jgi:uncharacterized protein (TIGR03118 family)